MTKATPVLTNGATSATAENSALAQLSKINPLIENDEWNADTAGNVASTIRFMASAIPSVVRNGGINEDEAHGAYVVLRTIASAVEVCHE